MSQRCATTRSTQPGEGRRREPSPRGNSNISTYKTADPNGREKTKRRQELHGQYTGRKKDVRGGGAEIVGESDKRHIVPLRGAEGKIFCAPTDHGLLRPSTFQEAINDRRQ